MIKLVCVVHKRAGMNTDDFRRYWREIHGPIAARIPGLSDVSAYGTDIALV
ncbi:MAG: hypothetical protein ACI88G_002164 [Woeseiaceae bacterium]|jgi:hypothetical protein